MKNQPASERLQYKGYPGGRPTWPREWIVLTKNPSVAATQHEIKKNVPALLRPVCVSSARASMLRSNPVVSGSKLERILNGMKA
jgi:hypothetical protein